MIYESLEPIERAEAEAALTSDDAGAVVRALLRLALHDPDGPWVQTACQNLADHPAAEVRRAVAMALGHLARLHGTLDLASALPLLKALAADPDVAGVADDALDDVEWYTHARSAAS
jgi:hypothetical protein